MANSGNKIDLNLIPGNILNGISIFGVVGNLSAGGFDIKAPGYFVQQYNEFKGPSDIFQGTNLNRVFLWLGDIILIAPTILYDSSLNRNTILFNIAKYSGVTGSLVAIGIRKFATNTSHPGSGKTFVSVRQNGNLLHYSINFSTIDSTIDLNTLGNPTEAPTTGLGTLYNTTNITYNGLDISTGNVFSLNGPSYVHLMYAV